MEVSGTQAPSKTKGSKKKDGNKKGMEQSRGKVKKPRHVSYDSATDL